jgi:hypothetical protein
MKDDLALKHFISYLKENDVFIFAGEGMAEKGIPYIGEGRLFIRDKKGLGLGLALGIAMSTKKRVFLFCEDHYFLRSISSVSHMAVSKCKNIFVVLFVNNTYSFLGDYPTIFDSFSAPKSMFFYMGFMTHDYTKHFRTVAESKGLKKTIPTLKGPLIITIRMDSSKISEDFKIENDAKNFREFVMNEELGTSMYEPPQAILELPEEN